MCGVFGVVSEGPIEPAVLLAAQAAQLHRGPDAQRLQTLTVGRWHIGLAHQRLAILDLSPAGVQPLLSPSGRSLIAYNGEVYNYLELRAELETHGVKFRTRTDTEVIAAACELFGIEQALQRLNGMWAFVWIDLAQGRVFLARDRFGVKPLYYYHRAGKFAFASDTRCGYLPAGAAAGYQRADVF
jgi:asparagine synthase (glutamine-hydrolysing)